MRHEEALELFGKRFEEEGATPAANNQLWTHAFYDREYYQQDQTRRMAIFDSVVEFLRSIGCQLTWSCCHDGSDIDFEYGIHINSITYKGENYEHNPCYNVRYEFPPELLEKLDAKFAVSADVQAPHNRDGEPQ
jgi:hypothetical protein